MSYKQASEIKTSFFSIDENGWFAGNDGARGPWDADACHAGPVAGLLARAAEFAVSDKQLVRLTTNFIRPIPMHGFKIESEVTRGGRTMSTTSVILVDRAGKICASATSLHLAVDDVGGIPEHAASSPSRKGSTPGEFAVASVPHGLPFFSNVIEIEYPPGEDRHPGPTTTWMRVPPILEEEIPSPFQRTCPLADCGNGLSRIMEVGEMSFINPDLTLVLHRPPESDWLASRTVSHWERSGIGLAQAELFDEKGRIGIALQTLIIRPH